MVHSPREPVNFNFFYQVQTTALLKHCWYCAFSESRETYLNHIAFRLWSGQKIHQLLFFNNNLCISRELFLVRETREHSEWRESAHLALHDPIIGDHRVHGQPDRLDDAVHQRAHLVRVPARRATITNHASCRKCDRRRLLNITPLTWLCRASGRAFAPCREIPGNIRGPEKIKCNKFWRSLTMSMVEIRTIYLSLLSFSFCESRTWWH